MAVGKELVEEIVKARTDKREYRRIVLPNSLQVLLISDPDTDKANIQLSGSLALSLHLDFTSKQFEIVLCLISIF